MSSEDESDLSMADVRGLTSRGFVRALGCATGEVYFLLWSDTPEVRRERRRFCIRKGGEREQRKGGKKKKEKKKKRRDEARLVTSWRGGNASEQVARRKFQDNGRGTFSGNRCRCLAGTSSWCAPVGMRSLQAGAGRRMDDAQAGKKELGRGVFLGWNSVERSKTSHRQPTSTPR